MFFFQTYFLKFPSTSFLPHVLINLLMSQHEVIDGLRQRRSFWFLSRCWCLSRCVGDTSVTGDRAGSEGVRTSRIPPLSGFSVCGTIWVCVTTYRLCLDGVSILCFSLCSTPWDRRVTLFLSCVTPTSWWGRTTSRRSATCTNPPCCTTCECDSSSPTPSTRTAVSERFLWLLSAGLLEIS